MLFGFKQIIRVFIVMLSLSVIMTSIDMPINTVEAQTKTKTKKKNIFQIIFGKKTKSVKKTTKKKRKTTGKRKTSSSKNAAVASVAKIENAQQVLMMGDFIGSGLADGLTAAYKKSANIIIVKKTRGASSIARPDNYDWLSKSPEIIAEIKPSLVIFNIGANDRQDMKVDGRWIGFDTDPWWAEYRKRVGFLAQVLRSQNVPILWVGVPSFKYTKMTRDVLAFNSIYRDEIEKAGGTFVDIWEGFVDENGKFIYTGSDINGQQVRLRASDGINLTKAGKRKMAFYVEKPASRFLSAGNSVLANLYENAPASAFINRPVQDPRLLTKTRVYSFTDPDLDGGDFLLGGNNQTRIFKTKSPLDQFIETGQIVNAPVGRVDDFTWNAVLQVKKPIIDKAVEPAAAQ